MTTERIRIYAQEGMTGLFFVDFKPSISFAMRDLHPPFSSQEWRISSIIEVFPAQERTPCACGTMLSHRVVVLTHQGTRTSLYLGACCLLEAG